MRSTQREYIIKYIRIYKNLIRNLLRKNKIKKIQVSEILAWDTKAHLVYYLGTRERRPGQRHLYVVRDPTADDPRHFEPLCVTCDLGEVLWSSRQVSFFYSAKNTTCQIDIIDCAY